MNNLQANICLLAVTLCWSCEVIIFSVIPDGVNPFATTCVTSLIGAAIMGACFARRIAEAFRRDRWLLARRVALLSIMNTSYNVLILMGLDYFDVSTGAFTLSMTVVVLPVLLIVMRRGVGVRTWASAGCVLAGIAVAVSPSFLMPQLPGLVLMLVSCAIRALYIVKLNDYAREHEPIALAAGISGINSVIAFVPWCAMQPTTFAALPWSTELIAAYVIHAYFIVGFATVLNIFAQRRATAAQATIIYSTEIVFSIIWACFLPAPIVDPVVLSAPIVVGCALIVVGNLLEIVPFGRRDTGTATQGGASAEIDAAEIDAARIDATGIDTAGRKLGDPSTEVVHGGNSSGQEVAGVSGVLGVLRKPLAQKVALFVVLLGVYLVLALPFKVLSVIPGFTDIRPVELLQPVYGIFFGLPGCFAFAVGNLIGDIVSDGLRWSSIAGFVANFAYPCLMYLFWCKLRKKPFDLRDGRTIGLMVLTMIVFAVIQAIIIAPSVALLYPDVDIALFVTSVVSNGSAFPVFFAIPLMILMQEELGFKPLE